MFRSSQLSHQPCGVYVAWHPWLDRVAGRRDHLFKVGWSRHLPRRLIHASYTTCFPPGWRYRATLEMSSEREAERLEAAVLHCLKNRRLGDRELVDMPLKEIVTLVQSVAATLNLVGELKENPQYDPRPTVRTDGEAQVTDDSPKEALLSAADLSALGNLRVGSLRESLSDLPTESLTTNDELSVSDIAAEQPTADATPPTAAHQEDAIWEGLPVPPEFLRLPPSSVHQNVIPSPQKNARGTSLFLRNYQQDAVAAIRRELLLKRRAILHMACRCGKTAVAAEILRQLAVDSHSEVGPIFLFLVPSRSLLFQTVMKLHAFGLPCEMLAVGSSVVIPIQSKRAKSSVTGPDAAAEAEAEEALYSSTTDPRHVRDFLSPRKEARLVVSTYHSSEILPTNAFDLTIFDECHRTCADSEKSFSYFLRSAITGDRLFMTATPVNEGLLSMSNPDLFGGVAYRYPLRSGIDEGHVNDYRIRFLLSPCRFNKDHPHRSTEFDVSVNIPGIIAAMSKVERLLVFCTTIDHAEHLADLLAQAPLPHGTQGFAIRVAHSRMDSKQVVDVITTLESPTADRCVIFNCRLFQEGVEAPALNAVFFAHPRHSHRDIVQSVCRPLTKIANKPPSFVFLPIGINPSQPLGHRENEENILEVLPFVQALVYEDGRLFEHFLDERSSAFDCAVTVTRPLREIVSAADSPLDLESFRFVKRIVATKLASEVAPRNHTLSGNAKSFASIPWERGFARLSTLIKENDRYPTRDDQWRIGNETIPLSTYYQWCRVSYIETQRVREALGRDGASGGLIGSTNLLQPHQMTDLESLPHWNTRGVEGGIYCWKEAMQYLERYLKSNHGMPPMMDAVLLAVDGFEATSMEHLASAISDVQTEPSRFSDRLIHFDAMLLRLNCPQKSFFDFVTEAERLFREHVAAHGMGQHSRFIKANFPGFPLKHLKQRMTPAVVRRVGLATQIPKLVKKQLTFRPDGQMECTLCGFLCQLGSEFKLHLRGAQHRAAVHAIVQGHVDTARGFPPPNGSTPEVNFPPRTDPFGDDDLDFKGYRHRQFACELCKTTFSCAAARTVHFQSPEHKWALRKVAAVHGKGLKMRISLAHVCKDCNVICDNEDDLRRHFAGRKHEKQMRKIRCSS